VVSRLVELGLPITISRRCFHWFFFKRMAKYYGYRYSKMV
jgi:hypothetical protein